MSRTLPAASFTLILAIALIAALVKAAAPDVLAASFPVTKTADTNDGTCDADCSLREAIVAANAAAGPDTISVPAGTYTLSIVSTNEDAAADGDLDITDSVTITGAGVGATIIDANELDRAFHVLFGAAGVQISDLTMTNGLTGRGGGLQNHGTLVLTNVVVSNSAGFNGGGIANDQGTLTLNNSTVQGNTTTGNSGAGIINDTGQLTINASTISGNATTGDDRVGGGIGNFGGTITITNSTISGNTATGPGGGIYNQQGEEGEPGTVTLTNVTINANTAITDGGGIFVDGTSSVAMKNTIVANSSGAPDCTGAFTSQGHNLDSDNTCDLTAAGDLPDRDPLLGPLASNGGPTQTHALTAGSPAIDAGDNVGCPSTDQRGVARPQGATCDIGAFELQQATPTPSATPSATPAQPSALPPTGGAAGSPSVALLVVIAAAAALAAAALGPLAFARVRR